jgi:hypothetical protein
MKLNWNTRNISVAGGLETKVHPKLVEPPKTTTADNVVYTTNGAARKRFGYTALPVTGGPAVGKAVTVSGQELLLNDGTSLWAWSPTTSTWQNKGATGPSGVNSINLAGTGSKAPGNVVSATIGNYTCVAYDSSIIPPQVVQAALPSGAVNPTTSGAMYVGIYDQQKANWLYAPIAPVAPQPGGSTVQVPFRPSVVAFGNYFYVFCLIAGASSYSAQFYTINATTLASAFTLAGPTTLFTNGVAFDKNVSVDAAVTPNGAAMFAVAADTGGGGSIDIYKFTVPGNTFSLSVNRVIPYGTALSLAVNNTYGAVTTGGTTPQIFAFDVATVTAAGGLTLAGFLNTVSQYLPVTINAANVVCVVSGSGPTGTAPNYVQSSGYWLGAVSGTNTVTSTSYQLYPWTTTFATIYPRSKPVYDGTNFAVWTVAYGFSATLQPTTALFSLPVGGSGTTTARVFYDTSIPTFGKDLSVSTSTFYVSTFSTPRGTGSEAVIPQALSSGELGAPVGLRLVSTTSGAAAFSITAQGVLVPGARPKYYDGTTIREQGFDAYPELPALAGSNAGLVGAGLVANATYFYAACWARIDAAGNRTLSAPSPPVSVVPQTGGGNPVVTTLGPFPTYAGATLVIFRTTAADPLNFRELTTTRTFSSAGDDQFTYNATLNKYVEATSDATLLTDSAAFPLLYAQAGSEIANDPVPAFSLAAATQQRVFAISAEDATRVYYSKPYNPGRPPEFSALQYLPIDPATGPCTAIGVLDGNVVIFKANAIYLLSGQGPDATGNGNFNSPLRLASDDGCVVPASILTTADGLFYSGARGINIIDRSLTIQYPGESVETLLSPRTVTAALYVQQLSQARFFLDNGTVAVYDTVLKRWSTFSNYPGVVSAVLFNTNAAALTSAGVVNVENAGFTDNGTPITMTIETGWIPVTESMQGWGRLRRVLVLGTYKSAHNATLSFAYDWDGYIDSVVFSSAAGLLNGDTVEQWRTRTKRQVMQSIRLKLIDSSITGESYDIVGLALEQATKSSTAKLPDAKSV